ncbi:MAG TPA: hypothetical protein ENK49_00955 [Gammaproteobacteria bacterium]|nr:hypothetical protein [Gammaproteobacteria bacterium]
MKEVSHEVMVAIDHICALGCDLVTARIQALQAGDSRPEYAALDSRQRASLLHELQLIMSIYEEKG